jgi:hypothetical protein
VQGGAIAAWGLEQKLTSRPDDPMSPAPEAAAIASHGNLLIIWIVVGLARPSLGLQIKSNPCAASAKKRLAHVLGLIIRRSGT